MNLLPKKQVQSQVQDERKQKIDEGIELAKKIDVLRETLTSLTKQHEAFIANMKGQLDNELETLRIEKGTLEASIVNLKQQQIQLRKPLDAEWELVKKKNTDAQLLLEQITKTRLFLETQQSLVEADKRKWKEANYKARVIERQLSKNLVESEDNKTQTEIALHERTELLERVKTEYEKFDVECKVREANIATKERELEMKQEGIDKEKEFIRVTKIQLDSQRRILERALAKNK